MSSLVVVDLTPTDKTKIAEYSALATETLVPFNGRFLAKGPVEVLHGEAPHPIKAVIEFPDADSARNWYNSEAYQAIVPLRNTGMQSQFHLI